MAVQVVLIPLTTTFSAPIACSSQFVMPDTSPPRKMYAFDPGQPIKDPNAFTCQPEEMVSWWAQNASSTRTALGGTAFLCPNLYYTAASITEGQNTRALIACCPSSYEFVTLASVQEVDQCRSILKPGILTFLAPGSDGLYATSRSLLAASSQMFAVQVNGYITQGTSSTSTTTTELSSIGSKTVSATPTISQIASSEPSNSSIGATPSPSQTAPSEPAGLSTSAEAGIGGGIGAVVLLAFLGALLWYRWRHNYKVKDGSKKTETKSEQELSAEQLRARLEAAMSK